MADNDSPHYGKNIKLDGFGDYKLTLSYDNPGQNHNEHFGRHSLGYSAVKEWYEPFELSYNFNWQCFLEGTK